MRTKMILLLSAFLIGPELGNWNVDASDCAIIIFEAKRRRDQTGANPVCLYAEWQ